MKNSLYLKKYVQIHPDNKMAWYLLGKEYEKSGQHGKANYCFNQSAGVFEAFEHSKVPSDIWMEYESRLLEQARLKDRRSRRIRQMLIVLMLALLMLVPSVNSPERVPFAQEEASAVTGNRSTISESINKSNPGKVQVTENTIIFTAQESGSAKKKVQGLANQLAQVSLIPDMLAVLGMEKLGDYLVWKHGMPMMYTLKREGNDALNYQSYDPKECNCEPGASPLSSQAEQWVDGQEGLATLNSGIRAFQSKKGRLPNDLSELLQPFPNNWVSGKIGDMEISFGPLLELIGGEGNQLQQEGSVNAQGPLAATWGSKPFLNEPLKIIVDKQNHRLAVVSGSVMIRNYEVGLGGGRTPEGQFVISDKVINPNGRDNGEFGSRGMQLSDTNFAIHGTNEPDSVGADESLGCVRMGKTDVEELFDLVPMGTPVLIGKGVLPDELLVPKKRFHTSQRQDQTNPHKTYHWLH